MTKVPLYKEINFREATDEPDFTETELVGI
jgi:hypothetical protein